MYDVIFISYNEINAEKNWSDLKTKVPYAVRIYGVKGIHQAHIAAANLATTPMVWIVDADAVMLDDFNFDYIPPRAERDNVHVWHSKNPINDLEYGYGGVKLFPRLATINMNTSKSDMTTSISDKFKLMPQVSNITAFNTDEFSTWRSAFRECAKLASKTIKGQVDEETEQRLDIWCTVANNQADFAEYAISGACAGREYGHANSNNLDALKLINDFDWLEQQFKEA